MLQNTLDVLNIKNETPVNDKLYVYLPSLGLDPVALEVTLDHLDALYHSQLNWQMLMVKFLAS